MATPILLLEGRRQGDYGPCLPLFLGSGGGFQQTQARSRKGVAMAHGFPLPEGWVEGDHDLFPCPLEKLRIVAFAILILTRGHGPWLSPSSYFHREEVKVWSWPLPSFFYEEGGKDTMAPASLSSWEVEECSAISGKEWERCGYGPCSPSSRRKDGELSLIHI